MEGKSTHTGGVKPMRIATRLVDQRERCIGMTEEERAWRKKWLKDQILSPNEPRHVPEYWKARLNPIRRFYLWPLETLFTKLIPIMGAERAGMYRYMSGKLIMVTGFVYASWYYFKYNKNDWTSNTGWRVTHSRIDVLPHHGNFPQLSDRTKPSDYCDRGFKNSPI